MCDIPRLPKRLHNPEKFFQYLILDDRHRGQWKNQPRLKRDFEFYVKHHPEFADLCKQPDSGQGIALFLANLVVNNPQPLQGWERRNRQEWALQCLACYLERSCYWAAKQVWERYGDRPWEDYLAIARFFVGDADKLLGVLAKYKSPEVKIATYVQNILVETIKTEADVGKFSDWRLLCETSKDELRESLQMWGTEEPQISWFLFVRKTFKQVYKINKVKVPTRKTGQTWPQPDWRDFWETAECCNVEKSLPSAPREVSVGLPTLDGKQVEKCLKLCIQVLRDYPQSINRQYSPDALQKRFEDAITYELSDRCPGSELPDIGKNSRKLQVNTVFLEQMEVMQTKVERGIQRKILKHYHRNIPVLYYGVGLTDSQIAAKFGIDRASVSRHLWNYYEIPLLERLASLGRSPKWFQSKVLQWLKKESCYPGHSDLIQGALVEAVKKLDLDCRKVLNLRSFENLRIPEISQQLGMTEWDVCERISQAQQCLEMSLFEELTNWHQLIVSAWLSRFWKGEIELVLGDEYSQIAIDGSMAKRRSRDVLCCWMFSTMKIDLDSEAELLKLDKLGEQLLSTLRSRKVG